jgi:hypothetical protein
MLFGAMLSARSDLRAAEPFSINENESPAVKVGDYKAMPNVVGIHLGMPNAAALATLRAAYKNSVQVATGPVTYPGYPKPVQLEYGVNINTLGSPPEKIWVESTPPPEPARVWRVFRQASDYNRPTTHAQLLAGLRQKYGKETVAKVGNTVARSDAEATSLWWLYDEQGRPAPLPGGGIDEVYQCLTKYPPGNSQAALVRNSTDRAPEHNYCTTSLVVVSADVTQTQDGLVPLYTVDAVDLPLATRASEGALAMMNDVGRRQQQEEIEKAQGNKPKL